MNCFRFHPFRVCKTTMLLICVIIIGGFLLGLISPMPAAIAADELFFSEYVEGSGNNKAVEIYNGSAVTVDLLAAGYAVHFYFNGNDQPGAVISLTGQIAPGDVYILTDNDAEPAMLTVADQIHSGSFFNGDDAVALVNNGVFVDVIGQIGSDPGSEWGTGTQDNTLRRKPALQSGDPDGSNPFDPAIEWDIFAKDTFDDLGRHTVTLAPATSTSMPTASPPLPEPKLLKSLKIIEHSIQ